MREKKSLYMFITDLVSLCFPVAIGWIHQTTTWTRDPTTTVWQLVIYHKKSNFTKIIRICVLVVIMVLILFFIYLFVYSLKCSRCLLWFRGRILEPHIRPLVLAVSLALSTYLWALEFAAAVVLEGVSDKEQAHKQDVFKYWSVLWRK